MQLVLTSQKVSPGRFRSLNMQNLFQWKRQIRHKQELSLSDWTQIKRKCFIP